ncbi:hypothetical protein [Sphingobacterium multivorum]|uniref:hypothetical protein n=1 Tax=Sphingobacterium multivorum TaxID=28454 RepID=UPI003DA1EC6B
MERIQELHNQVFDFLQELRNSDTAFKDLKYTLRKDNFGNKLQEGYWFLGEDVYFGDAGAGISERL